MLRSLTAAHVLALLLVLGCESQDEYRLDVAHDVFDRNCARCHGSSKGEGPQFVESFGAPAPDLRELWRKHGSPLPREELAAFIDGRLDVESHGPREMPVWGEQLYRNLPQGDSVEDMRAGTIALLLDHLESIQTD